MKNINILSTPLMAILFLCVLPDSFAHFGPRGLLAGSPHLGIHYNGNVYLGTEEAGVFESTNTGLTAWRLRAVGLKSGHITALTHSGAELYAGTDSGVFIFNGMTGSDRFWNERNNGLGSLDILSLMATEANTVYAGTDGSGLYKTTDKGLNWTAVNNTHLNGKDITALTRGGSRLFALVRDGGVFASDDNGTNWFSLNDANTLNKTASTYFSYNGNTDELMVSNTDGLWLLTSASTTNSPAYATATSGLPMQVHIHGVTNSGSKWYLASHSGVFQSAVSSISWASANTGLPNNNVSVIVPVDDTLIVGMKKKGVYKTNANTINWVATNTGMNNVGTYSLACMGDSMMLTATEYGIVLSTNIGNNPVLINNGLTDSLHVNDVEIAENMFWAATTSSGVFMSNNMGQSWSAQNTGLSNMHIKKIIYGSGRIFIIDSDGIIFQSGTSNVSWTQITNGLPSNPAATSLAFFGNNLLLGTYGNGVWVKHRDSANWNAFNTGLSDMNVTSVTYAAGKVYAGTDGSGVFVSNDGTAGWAAAAAIALSHFSHVPFLRPEKIQYMTTIREYVVATFKGGVAGTTDGGATWVPAGNQFNLPSYTNVYKASYVTSRLFVTTEANSTFGNSMGELDFTDSLLEVHDVNTHVPASASESYHSITSNVQWAISTAASWITLSDNAGFWSKEIKLNIAANTSPTARMATVTITGDTMTRTITVHQDGFTNISKQNSLSTISVYPNPAKGRFTIDFNGNTSVTSVSVGDVTGKKIAAIPAEHKGYVEISETLAPGVYFVHIHTVDESAVRKVIVQ